MNTPSFGTPEDLARLEAIDKRLEAVRGKRDPAYYQLPEEMDSDMQTLLCHAAGDCDWLVWSVTRLVRQRRELNQRLNTQDRYIEKMRGAFADLA